MKNQNHHSILEQNKNRSLTVEACIVNIRSGRLRIDEMGDEREREDTLVPCILVARARLARALSNSNSSACVHLEVDQLVRVVALGSLAQR